MKVFVDNCVLIISPETWEHNFVSKHHYAIALAAHGNRVYFLNPPSAAFKVSKTDFENLFVVDYKPLVRGLNRLPLWVARLFMELDVRKLLNLINHPLGVVWSFDPFRFQYLNAFKSRFRIYYAADVHYAIEERQQVVADQANIVLSPSAAILDLLKTKSFKKVMQHAVADYFFKDLMKAVTLPGKNKVKVLYVGNLSSKYLDHKLGRKVVLNNLNLDFIFIGDKNEFDPEMSALPNVYCIGRQKNEEVCYWLQQADILWLYYDTDTYPVAASNSHKIMEYLSAGKPIVSTRIQAYVDNDLVIMPEDNQHLPNLVKSIAMNLAAHTNLEKTNARVTYAKSHSYSEQLKKIDELLCSL